MAVDISQYVAQFGKRGTGNPGAGMAYGLQAQGLKQRNRLAELAREDKAQERNAMATKMREQDYRDFATDGIKAILSAETPEQEQAMFQGWRNEGMRRSYDMDGIPDQLTEDFKYHLAGKAGVELPGAADAKLTNFKRTEDGKVVGYNAQTGAFEPAPLPEGMSLADTSPQVNITNAAEKAGMTEEQKALAKSRVSQYEDVRNKALAAEEQNAGLAQLENMDVQTGFGQGALAQVSRAINALGGNGEALTGVDPANVQAFNAMTGKLVLDVMSGQKGPQTDADQARIAKTLPGIANEQKANQFNINALRALNMRRVEMADFYDRYLEDNKGSLQGVQRAWFDYKQKTPLLSDNVKDPATGLPMFFYNFREKLRQKNPGASEEQVLRAWRQLTTQ